MFVPRAPQALGFIPVVVVALLVAESSCFPTQHASPQVISNDFGATELGLSIAVNQMTLLRMLNEPSTPSKTRHKIYRVYEQDAAATHSQAIQACRQLGGRLALPTNQEEDLQIRKLIGIGFGSKVWPYPVYWLSSSDEQEEGKFIDNITGQPLKYTNFESGQPDNAGGREDCVHLTTVYTGWNDVPCNEKGGFVCEFMD